MLYELLLCGVIIMDKVKVSELIICTKGRRGKGDNKLSPVRVLTEVFDFDGELIAENDCHSISIESLIDFIKYRFKDKEQEKILEWAWEYFIEDSD